MVRCLHDCFLQFFLLKNLKEPIIFTRCRLVGIIRLASWQTENELQQAVVVTTACPEYRWRKSLRVELESRSDGQKEEKKRRSCFHGSDLAKFDRLRRKSSPTNRNIRTVFWGTRNVMVFDLLNRSCLSWYFIGRQKFGTFTWVEGRHSSSTSSIDTVMEWIPVYPLRMYLFAPWW